MLVVTRGPCCGAPGHSPIDERRNLVVQSWDLRRPLDMDNSAGPPPSAGFRLLAEASCQIICCVKLRRMIIVINVKLTFKWVSRIDLALHLS